MTGLATLGALVATLTMIAMNTEQPAAAAPRVVATFPAEGARIEPGRFVLRVTFDRPMQAGSYSFVTIDGARYPDCTGKPRQSADRRSFAISCSVNRGEAYGIGFNQGRFRNFVSADQSIPAEPATLRFAVR